MTDQSLNLIAWGFIILVTTSVFIWIWCEAKEYFKIRIENQRLKSILFTIGEIAVSNFDNHIVGLVDRTLPKGFKISEEEHNQNLGLSKKKKDES